MKNFRKRNFLIAILLFVVTLIVYTISHNGEGRHWNYFIFISDAFLNGRLNILTPPSWLNELVNYQGKYYSVFPPMPAILLMPLVILFGSQFYQPVLAIFLGSVNVFLSYFVFLKLFQRKTAIWMSVLYAFGTIQWYHAEVGSAWYLAHIVALFFLWLAILETMTKQRLFLIGLFLGCAYLSRIPTILAVFFILFYLHERFIGSLKNIRINFKSFLFFGLGLLPALLFNAWYNYQRFGVFQDIGYTLLPISNEPWYSYGFVSIFYIPIHLKEMFTSMPVFISQPPYAIPNLFAMAIWFITPAYFLILFANWRNKLILAASAGALVVAIPSLMHGGNGFTQFGYRHTLDYMPFLLLLTASGFQNKPIWWAKLLIILSILINLWGVVMISHFNIWRI